ncbi:MAG: hypothetical protein ABEK03_10825 [Candidatus Bipolaricaulia bacterium]
MRRRSMGIALAAVVVGLAAFAQTGDYFENYPGGRTDVTYEIQSAELDGPISLGWRVEPASGDQFKVVTTNRVTASREALNTGVANGVAQVSNVIQNNDAVQALLENSGNLEPNETFFLPDGAQFQAAGRETIQGVSVICGLLTTSDTESERIMIGVSGDPTLPFPPFIRQEQRESSGIGIDPLPTCKSIKGVLGISLERYSVPFQLIMTSYERQPAQ